eukprot:840134_1
MAVSCVSCEVDIEQQTQQQDVKEVELETTIFNLVFMRELNGMNQTQYEKWRWRCLVMVIISVQTLSLIALSHAFVTEWNNLYKRYGADYPDKQIWRGRASMITAAPLWFACVMTALIVTATYLLKSLRPFLVLLSVLLAHHDDVTLPLYHGLPLSSYMFGMLMVFFKYIHGFSAWALAIFIAFHGLFFQIANPSDIVLIAVGNVFILEIDDYICEYFVNSSISLIYSGAFWRIKVNITHYYTVHKPWERFYLIELVGIAIAFTFQSAYVFGKAVNEHGVSYLFRMLYQFYGMIFGFTLMVSVPAAITCDKLRNILIHIGWVCFFALQFFWVAVSFALDGSKPFFLDGAHYKLILYYCIGLALTAAVVYLGAIKNHVWENRIFIGVQVSLWILAFVDRVHRGAYAAENMFILLFGIGTTVFKYDGEIMFTRLS